MRIFRWRDFLTFGLAAIIMTVLAAWAQMTPQPNPEAATVGRPIAWSAAVLAWVIYGVLLYWRARAVKRITVVLTEWNISVIGNGHQFSVPDLRYTIQHTLDLWKPWTSTPERFVVGVVIIFKDFPFQQHGVSGPLTGLAYEGTRTLMVGFAQPLIRSALPHELGHLIFYGLKRQGTHAVAFFKDYHEFASAHRLP